MLTSGSRARRQPPGGDRGGDGGRAIRERTVHSRLGEGAAPAVPRAQEYRRADFGAVLDDRAIQPDGLRGGQRPGAETRDRGQPSLEGARHRRLPAGRPGQRGRNGRLQRPGGSGRAGSGRRRFDRFPGDRQERRLLPHRRKTGLARRSTGRFLETGITDVAEKIVGPRAGEDLEAQVPRAKKQTAKLEISVAKEASPGIHRFRVKTPLGTTNLVAFAVGTLPEVVEREKTNVESAANLTTVELPATLVGKIGAPGDMDSYQFEGKEIGRAS